MYNHSILVFFCIMTTFGDSDDDLPSVLSYASSTQLKDTLIESYGETTTW